MTHVLSSSAEWATLARVMGLSLRAYARHRAEKGLPGASLQAVQRARDRGRITLEADGTVDPARADEEWAANTDLSEAPVAVVVAHARVEAPREKPPTAEPGSQHRVTTGGAALAAQPLVESGPPVAVLGASLAENNAAKVYWQARQAELKFKQAAGELVPAADVRSELETVFRTCRTRLLGIPARAVQALPELDARAVAVLEGLIREALEGLANEGSER